MKKVLIMMMCVIMVVCFMPTVAMAAEHDAINTAEGLKQAIQNASENDVINLSGDIELTSQLNINKPVTINGNNHTITSNISQGTSGESAAGILITANANLKNLKVIGPNQNNPISWKSGFITVKVYGGEVTLDNVEFTRGSEALQVSGSGTQVTISGTQNYNGNVYNGIEVKQGATLIIGENTAFSNKNNSVVWIDNGESGTVTDTYNVLDVISDKNSGNSFQYGYAVAKVDNEKFGSLTNAINAAADGDTIEIIDGITVSQEVTIDKKSLTINGNGKKLSRNNNGVVLAVKYADGVNVSINNLTVDGNAAGGALNWIIDDSYKGISSPQQMPQLSVNECTFNNSLATGGAGIGLWAYSQNWFDQAASEVTVNGCTFNGVGVGIYYNEEAPLLNLKSTITSNTFKNIGWTGLAGIPANAEIANNTFESTCNQAMQYLFNNKQTSTNTVIINNTIDSPTGIEFMPYHLNENNVNGGGKTVKITSAMIPVIKQNIRHTDTDIVTLVAYRQGTDEKTVFEGSIDLTSNYTKGVAPTVKLVPQSGTDQKPAPSEDSLKPVVKNDSYYVRDTMRPQDLNTYIPPYIPPTTPTDNVTNSGTSGTDNATTSADLSGSTSTSNGTTSATVDKTTADKIVDKAVENKSTEVVIDATANTTTAANSTTIAQVTIPTDTLGAIAEKTEADVTIKTDVAEVKMDNAAAAAVSEQAEGDTVQIIAEKVKEDATEVHFELKVVCSDGKVISDFKGGNVAVTVALPKAMADKKVVCVYIDDNGHMSKVAGQKNADGTYTFNTGHFSSYAIMAEEEADAAIAAQKEAIKNIKIKLTSKQVKTKAGKKAVKITWTADAGDKVLDGVEVFRSTERYKGYGTEPFYTSTKGGNTGSYTNTKSLKKGTRYYYRVRGYVLVDGQKVYTDYSTKAWRTVK